MASNPKAALAAAGGLVAAVVLFVVLQGGKEEPGPEPQAPTIVVEGGQPVGGAADLKFSAGDDIRFAVESDISGDLHLHGYDVLKPIQQGQRAEFDVPATIEGVFELELEQGAVSLAQISVIPD